MARCHSVIPVDPGHKKGWSHVMVEVIVEVKQHGKNSIHRQNSSMLRNPVTMNFPNGYYISRGFIFAGFNFASSFTIAKNAKLRTDKVVSLTAARGGVK